MPFKLPESFYEKQREIYEKKYILLDNGEQIHVSSLEDRSVTPEMKATMRMNSFAQDDLPPKLTDEALIETVKHYKNNCSRAKYPCSTYDEALVHILLPELVKRLEEKQQSKQKLEDLLTQITDDNRHGEQN